MALTTANKADIRFYLGFSARFHSSDSQLEHAMSALESDTDAETIVLSIITQLKTIDTQLTDTHGRLKALKVCDIVVAHKKEICALRAEGRRLVGRVASTLGVPIRHDVYSSSAPAGFSTAFGPSGRNEIQYG